MSRRATDHVCPQCGSNLAPTEEKGLGFCIACSWSGDLEDAVLDTTSPFDVEARRDEVLIHLSTDQPATRLSANKAEAFSEALAVAARDARGHRDPEDSHV